MENVLANLRAGRYIEAIKAFRTTYGAGLKEAKAAIDAIKPLITGVPAVAWPVSTDEGHFIVVHRPDYDYEFTVTNHYNKAEAVADANQLVDHRESVMVAKVIARSETVRKMVEAA